jgi:hypothetical protein
MATSTSLPLGWRMDYDHEASRCFFVWESTGSRQWEFPKPGDEPKESKEAKVEPSRSEEPSQHDSPSAPKPAQEDLVSPSHAEKPATSVVENTAGQESSHVSPTGKDSKTEPANSDKPEPAQTESVKAEAAKVEAAKVEAAKVEAAKVEAAKVEAAKVEPAEAQLTKPNPTKVEPVKVDPVKVDLVKAEPVKVDPVKLEPVKVEPVKAENVKVEPDKLGSKIQNGEEATKPTITKPIPTQKVAEHGTAPAGMKTIHSQSPDFTSDHHVVQEDSAAAAADSSAQDPTSGEVDADQTSLNLAQSPQTPSDEKVKKWKTSKWASKALKKTVAKTESLANKSMPEITSAAKKTRSIMATTASKSGNAMKGVMNSSAVKFVGATVGDTVVEIAGRHFGLAGASSLVNSGISKISTINKEIKTNGIGAVADDLVAISTEIADTEQLLVAEVQNRLNGQKQSENSSETPENNKAETPAENEAEVQAKSPVKNEDTVPIPVGIEQTIPSSSTPVQSLALLQTISSAANTRLQSTMVQSQLSKEVVLLLGQQANEQAQSLDSNAVTEAALSIVTAAETRIVDGNDAAADILAAVDTARVNPTEEDSSCTPSAVKESVVDDTTVAKADEVASPLSCTGQLPGQVVLTPQYLQSLSPTTPASEAGSYFVLPAGVQIIQQGNQFVLVTGNPTPPASPLETKKASVSISEASMSSTPMVELKKAMTLSVDANEAIETLAEIKKANTFPLEADAASTASADAKENTDSAPEKGNSSGQSNGLKKILVNLTAPAIMTQINGVGSGVANRAGNVVSDISDTFSSLF